MSLGKWIHHSLAPQIKGRAYLVLGTGDSSQKTDKVCASMELTHQRGLVCHAEQQRVRTQQAVCSKDDHSNISCSIHMIFKVTLPPSH